MKWVLVSRRDHRRAFAWVASGIIAFVAAGLAGGLGAPLGVVFWGSAGFVSFVLCVGRAMGLWRVDEMVFDHRRRAKFKKPAAAPTFQNARNLEGARRLRHV
jgi:hypothetical protein